MSTDVWPMKEIFFKTDVAVRTDVTADGSPM
jgi:hypothetical protein